LCWISTLNTLISVEAITLDATDRQIIHILTIVPRASFRTIADVAGISEQTAARRYRRLGELAGLRVLGAVDGSLLGWTEWFVRLQTTPGSADSIAAALARRPDTRWVRLASGGTEVSCTLRERSAEERDALFLRGLPGSRRVVQISAHSILHNFTPRPWQELTTALTPAQLARADVLAHPADRSGGAALLPEDQALLAELGRDGRASHAALAAALHRHESTVRRRMDELRQSGLLHFEVDIDNRAFGMSMQVILWLSVEPSRLDETGRALAAHREIPFAAATTGPTNLMASAAFRDTRHLYEYLTGELAALPGVSSVQTAPVIRTLKRHGPVRLQADADHDPDRDAAGIHGERAVHGDQAGGPDGDGHALPGRERAGRRRDGHPAEQAGSLGDGPGHRAARGRQRDAAAQDRAEQDRPGGHAQRSRRRGRGRGGARGRRRGG
jgi:DNA-binding Lrp family transcriptional regulator